MSGTTCDRLSLLMSPASMVITSCIGHCFAECTMCSLQSILGRLCVLHTWRLCCSVNMMSVFHVYQYWLQSGLTHTGSAKAVKNKKGGEAWTLNQSSKDPRKVNAAKQALTGKLSKPVLKKPTAAQKSPQVAEHRHCTALPSVLCHPGRCSVADGYVFW